MAFHVLDQGWKYQWKHFFHLFHDEKIEEKKEHLKNNSIVSRPSIIFDGFHGEENTYTIKWGTTIVEDHSLRFKCLYLWGVTQEMPTDKHEYIKTSDVK